ncbi:hypothetical protein H8959_011980 [Pygathrix nigripes]
MASGRLIKFVVFELLEFAAFSIPTLVIMEQFATAYQGATARSDNTPYWLIVSCSVAYVALVTLLIWVPVQILDVAASGNFARRLSFPREQGS